MDNDYKRRFDNASSQASLRNEAAEIESHPLASRTPVQNDRLRQIDVELQKLIREAGTFAPEVGPLVPSPVSVPSSVPAPSPGLDVNKEADIDTGTLLTHPTDHPEGHPTSARNSGQQSHRDDPRQVVNKPLPRPKF